MKFDLRQKLNKNDTYEIEIIGSFSTFHCFYWYDGINFIRILYNGNLLIYNDFKKTLTPKEFKEILSRFNTITFNYHYFKR